MYRYILFYTMDVFRKVKFMLDEMWISLYYIYIYGDNWCSGNFVFV